MGKLGIFTQTKHLHVCVLVHISEIGTLSELPRPIPRNSVESDHGCTSRIYFDNAGDNVTLALNNATLTSQNMLHNNKFDCSKTNGLNEVYNFSLKYR